MVAHVRRLDPASDEGGVRGLEVVDREGDLRDGGCPASDRRFSTMPICSTQNLRQASASFTYSTTYETFMIDSPERGVMHGARALDIQHIPARRLATA